MNFSLPSDGQILPGHHTKREQKDPFHHPIQLLQSCVPCWWVSLCLSSPSSDLWQPGCLWGCSVGVTNHCSIIAGGQWLCGAAVPFLACSHIPSVVAKPWMLWWHDILKRTSKRAQSLKESVSLIDIKGVHYSSQDRDVIYTEVRWDDPHPNHSWGGWSILQWPPQQKTWLPQGHHLISIGAADPRVWSTAVCGLFSCTLGGGHFPGLISEVWKGAKGMQSNIHAGRIQLCRLCFFIFCLLSSLTFLIKSQEHFTW